MGALSRANRGGGGGLHLREDGTVCPSGARFFTQSLIQSCCLEIEQFLLKCSVCKRCGHAGSKRTDGEFGFPRS